METIEGKGFAFVAFRSKDDVQKAIEELHNKDFKVWIIHSQSRKKRLCKKKCCCLRPYIIMHFHSHTVPYYTIPSPVSTYTLSLLLRFDYT
ncbi:putative RNA recognition motif domain, nucleotide-binding alpha-beta plait domain superfamily [Helianthus annuus]|nr:putative RNA recognition motif domain, nucleotide-binding alpha-beta plait domain superfamily [Helianthus annuus]